ncbi:MAG: TolC family protein [Bacteroidales bacterium]
MRRIRLKWLGVFVFVGLLPFMGRCQEAKDTTLRLSLEEAQAYALEHSTDIRNAHLDVLKAKKQVWEVTASGLPQLSAKGSYQYIPDPSEIQIPTRIMQMLDPSIPDNAPPQSISFVKEEDMKVDFTVSQLIFSGSYIVGLQSSKVYKSLTQKQLELTRQEVKATIANSYYMVLVAKANRTTLSGLQENLKQTLYEMEQMHAEGFIEDTDVDQISLTLHDLTSAINTLENQIDVGHKMLKYQLGLKLTDEVILTDKLTSLLEDQQFADATEGGFTVGENINYQLLETQEKLTALQLKNEKYSFLPTAAAFANYTEILKEDEFADQMVPTTVIGISVELPIFTSGQRMAKLAQAKIELDKVQNNLQDAEKGLTVQYLNARSEYITAVENYENKERSRNLAQRIYDKTLEKYREGVASSLDLTQTQNQYLQAESNYYQAALSMMSAKIALEKILTEA